MPNPPLWLYWLPPDGRGPFMWLAFHFARAPGRPMSHGECCITRAGRRCPSDIGPRRPAWRSGCSSCRSSTSTGRSSHSSGWRKASTRSARTSGLILRSQRRWSRHCQGHLASSPSGPIRLDSELRAGGLHRRRGDVRSLLPRHRVQRQRCDCVERRARRLRLDPDGASASGSALSFREGRDSGPFWRLP